MTKQNIIGKLRTNIWQTFNKKDQRLKYAKILIIMGIIVAAFGLGFFLYNWYVRQQEQSTQLLFAESVELFEKQEKKGTAESFDTIAQQFKRHYDANVNSNLAPFFMLFQADALQKAGKEDEALVVMKSLIDEVSQTPFLRLFETKYALMLIDSGDEQKRENGIHELIQLARDTHNIYRDYAAFYLGRYYWAYNKLDQAKQVWQELVNTYNLEQIAQSPWAQEAQIYLKQMTT